MSGKGDEKIKLSMNIWPFLIAISMATSLALVGCSDHTVYAFPTHNEQLPTDWGRIGDHIMVELAVENGCLRAKGPSPSYLLVWPEGFTLVGRGISDSDGAFKARIGDTVRFSGRLIDPKSDLGREVADMTPDECPGPYYLVGDEVSLMQGYEPTIVSIPGSSLYFQRRETRKWKGMHEDTLEGPGTFRMELEGDCLMLTSGYGRGHVALWPAGFHPRIGEGGVVEVRNGGGQTIARVGDRVSVRGGERAYVPECGVKGWYAKEPRNADLPVAFPRHDRERPGLDYARGNLNMQNGCMYIRA